MAIETWIEEFLFRGRPPSGPGSDMPSEYHVMVGRQQESGLNPGKYERALDGPMTPEQALERYGLDAGQLVAGINATAVSGAMELAAARERIAEQDEAAKASAEALQAAQGQAQDALTALVALRERVASLEAMAARLAAPAATEDKPAT